MSAPIDYYVCGICAARSEKAGDCARCGSDTTIAVTNGYLSGFPAASVPCPGCGSTAAPLVFRGWVRLYSFALWTREQRIASYLCRDCALAESTKTLLMNALIGWWSLQAFFFYGWRAIYHNWRSIWSAPVHPLDWGAISAHEFAAGVQEDYDEAFAAVENEWLLDETPLSALSDTRAGLVLSAQDIYEQLAVSPDASLDDLRRAFRRKAKCAHPDLRSESSATDEMVRLNRAWEILRDPQMRAAYDWLEQQRVVRQSA